MDKRKIIFFLIGLGLLALLALVLFLFIKHQEDILTKTSETTQPNSKSISYTYGGSEPAAPQSLLARGEIVNYNPLSKTLILKIDEKISQLIPFSELEFNLSQVNQVTCWPELAPGTQTPMRDTFISLNGQDTFRLTGEETKELSWNSPFFQKGKYVFVAFKFESKLSNQQPISNINQVIVVGCGT